MQGRLLTPEPDRFQAFPRERWRQEFALAAQAGLSALEWIYDVYGADVNPIGTDEGIAEMRQFSAQYGVAVVSLCADYFMERPLDVVRIEWLMHRCRRAGIERMVLPLVDGSRMKTAEDRQRAAALLQQVTPCGVEIHLETDLAPADFAAFLQELPPWMKVNYDAGNSASLGYSPAEEFAAYGQRIGSVHIKDRLLGGGTVALGHGNADLAALARALDAFAYAGDFTLQVARGKAGNELDDARRNLAFVRQWWTAAR